MVREVWFMRATVGAVSKNLYGYWRGRAAQLREKGELVKHIFSAALALAALGLMVSCGSDDFGLSAETRSGIDSNWEAQSAFEQAATCEQLQSPSERLKASEKLQEDLSAETRVADELAVVQGRSDAETERLKKENEKTAEGMISYLKAKC